MIPHVATRRIVGKEADAMMRKFAPRVQHPAPTVFQDVFGLDLGKQKDYAALAALKHLEADCPTTGAPFDRYTGNFCLATKRWNIGTSYVTVVDETKTTVTRPQWRNPVLVVDASGVGQPVVDYMRKIGMGCQVVPVTITGGNSQRFQGGYWWVAKAVLVSNMQIALNSGELQLAPKVQDLLDEFRNFQVDTTKSGNEVYGARDGEHDDLVMALCLALWYVNRRNRKIKVKR